MTPGEFLAAQRERARLLAALDHMVCKQCRGRYNAHKMDCSYSQLDHDLRCPDCALKMVRTADAPASYEAHGEKAEWLNPTWACVCGVRITGEPEDNSRELAMERMYRRVIGKIRLAAIELVHSVCSEPTVDLEQARARAADLYKLITP